MAKRLRVLLIAEYVAPVQAVASIRWTKLAKYLKKNHDVCINILTNEKHYGSCEGLGEYIYDSSSVDDFLFDSTYEIPKSLKTTLIFKACKMAKLFLGTTRAGVDPGKKEGAVSTDKTHNSVAKEGTSFYARIVDFVLSSVSKSWVDGVFKSGVDASSYDVIISTFGPRWPHEIAQQFKEENPNAIWVADFRDPANSSGDVGEYEKATYPIRATQGADLILTVWDNDPDILGIGEAISELTLTNGFDPDEMHHRNRIRSEKFVISYTGTLYNSGRCVRDLSPLLRAVEDLIRTARIPVEDIEIVYAGPSSEEFQRQCQSFSLVPALDRGFLPRNEALRLQDESAILLLATWNTCEQHGVITGKIFEYLSSGVPILGLCSGNLPNSATKEIIERAKAGFCYEEPTDVTDYPKLKEFILDNYQKWKADGLTPDLSDKSFIANFGYDKLADVLYEIIESKLELTEKA